MCLFHDAYRELTNDEMSKVMKNEKFNETGENFVMVQLPFCSLVEPLLFCLMLLHSLVGCQNVMQSLPGLSCMCLFHPSDKSIDEIFHNCHRYFVKTFCWHFRHF